MLVFSSTGKLRFRNGLPAFDKTCCCVEAGCACLPDTIPTYLYATVGGFTVGTCCSNNNGLRGPMVLETGPDGCARWVRSSVNGGCESNTQTLTGWWEPHPTDVTKARFLIHAFQSASTISNELNCLWGSPYVTIPVDCCAILPELEFTIIDELDHVLGWDGRCGTGTDPTVFISEVGGCCKQDPINYPEEEILCCCGGRPLPLWPLAENALPSQLTLTVVSSTGCPCAVTAFDGLTLNWGGADWFGDGDNDPAVENCDARGYRVVALCDNFVPFWNLTFEEPPLGTWCFSQLTGVLQPGWSCNPVNANFAITFPTDIDCCDGVGGVVIFNISEATPLMAMSQPKKARTVVGYGVPRTTTPPKPKPPPTDLPEEITKWLAQEQ